LSQLDIANEPAQHTGAASPVFRPSLAWRVGDLAIDYGVYVALVGSTIAFTVLYGGEFLSRRNLLDDIGNSAAVTVVVGVGLTIALAAGQIDFSGGSLMALVSVVFGGLVLHNNAQNGSNLVAGRTSILVAVVAAVAVAVAVGLLNGLFVVNLGIFSLLATFPAAILAYALAGIVTHPHGSDTYFVPGSPAWNFTSEAVQRIGGVSVSILIAAAVVVVGWTLLERTRLGAHFKAAGANPTAALRAGIPVPRITRYAFLITALTAAVAAYLAMGQAGFGGLPVGNSQGGFGGVSVNALTAVLIGGAQLQGGAARVERTVAGALFVGVVADGLQLGQVNVLAQGIVVGALFIVAVSLSSLAMKRRAR
jgi:ribose transport system permease protein